MARPVKLVRCVQCGENYPTSFVRPEKVTNKRGVCYVCEPPGASRMTPEQLNEASSMYASKAALIMDHRENLVTYHQAKDNEKALRKQLGRRKPRSHDSIDTEKLNAALKLRQDLDALFAASTCPRCKCCRSHTDLGQDSEGTYWCAQCAHYVFKCGRCIDHVSEIFFPALAGQPEPLPFVDLSATLGSDNAAQANLESPAAVASPEEEW